MLKWNTDAAHICEQLDGFTTFYYVNCGGPYEWDEFHVMRSPSGQWYTAHDSGCSCNWFGLRPPTMTPARNLHEIIQRAHCWAAELPRRRDVARLVEQLRLGRKDFG